MELKGDSHLLAIQNWLDDRGEPLSDEELRKVARNWTQSNWDEYLDWFCREDGEALQLCPPSKAERDLPIRARRPHAQLVHLQPTEKLLIHLRFWRCFEIEEISELLERSWDDIDHSINEVLEKLRRLLSTSDQNSKNAA